ncbi:voltage-dependent calcium channel subunit alpha-2/delta-1 [Ixodes scapularis]|uniref:voltage-dependent calcium channel subunit alpha-2/delta-1 n=1 Tax=Ixodes scapularis TaxID=6945 RepID=UPI001C37EC52|nr:voltage-dependent calcium channel subunit alpha-2/delta-1 [Ixodes scapularis]
MVYRWANELDTTLVTRLSSISGIETLRNSYENAESLSLVEVNGTELLLKMTLEMEKNLQRKKNALKRLVKKAEEAVVKHKFVADLTREELGTVMLKDLTESDGSLRYSDKFHRYVNESYSGAHVPLEIYEEDAEVLNGLKWSQALDEAFRQNAGKDPDLLWQYFGSEVGYMRMFPANRWKVAPGKPDLFDVRMRPWFIDGSSSPKDVIVLMDTSGSMHGPSMEIMKLSVKSLLKTFEENDFINVAWFAREVRWVSCFDTLVQANRRNKRILSKSIDRITDGGTASLSHALDFAFQNMADFQENRTTYAGAECIQIIMIFTDGGTEDPTPLVKKLNTGLKIRIFTYVVGPHPIPYATLKALACNNRGYFTAITSFGASRYKVQEYLKVLSRPMVLSGEKQFAWTNFYQDSGGIGLLTTATLPVYNKTQGTKDQAIVGVMGVDVSLEELKDHEPTYKIGPSGYSFMINRNGYVMYHPDIKLQLGSLEEPLDIDFLDVEIENPQKEKIRELMIEGRSGKETLRSLIRMPDEKHLVPQNMVYFYTHMNESEFGVGLAFPERRKLYVRVEGMRAEDGFKPETEKGDGVLLAPWRYCKNVARPKGPTGNLSQVLEAYRADHRQCDPLLMQRLLWDIENTRAVVNNWTSDAFAEERDGILGTFVGTEGGLIRYHPENIAVYLIHEANPQKAAYFRRALYAEDFVFLISNVKRSWGLNATQEHVIIAAKAVDVYIKKAELMPAVVGLLVEERIIHESLMTMSANGSSGGHLRCADEDFVICYLLDDGGFIITSSGDDHAENVGKFVGAVDPELMDDMLKKSVYFKIEELHTESRCPRVRKYTAGARSSMLPLKNIFHIFDISWVLDAASWQLLKVWIYTWLWSLTTLGAQSAKVAPKSSYAPDDYRVCTTREALYHFGNRSSYFMSSLDCGNCSRQYGVGRVGYTNVILVISKMPCAPVFCDPPPTPLQAPIEVDDPAPCQHPLRYRRRPDKCYADHAKEDYRVCGRASTSVTSTVALISSALALAASAVLVAL